MKLSISRFEQVPKATIGLFRVDGKFRCFTLEDVVRDVKIPKETAIPEGTYPIEVRWSNHFQRNMPHINNVPGFVGVLFHWGNSDIDTEGCPILGEEHRVGQDWIGHSKVIFDKIFDELVAKGDEENTIEITNDF